MWLYSADCWAEVDETASMKSRWLLRTHQTRHIHRKWGGTQNLSEIDIPMVGHRQISDSDQHSMCLALANKSGFTLRARRRAQKTSFVRMFGLPHHRHHRRPRLLLRGGHFKMSNRDINGNSDIQRVQIQRPCWNARHIRCVVRVTLVDLVIPINSSVNPRKERQERYGRLLYAARYS